MDTHLFLTGFMGSGKSTIGRALARRLNRPFIDTDDRIEKGLKMEISDIFATHGEVWFRAYEEEVVSALVSMKQKAVFSLGGGTLLSQNTIDLILHSGKLIYIKSEPGEIWKRIKHSTRRPLLRPDGEVWEKEEYLGRMATLMNERKKGYQTAHMSIDRDGKEVDEIVTDILARLSNS